MNILKDEIWFHTIGFFHEKLTKSPVEYWFIFRHAKVYAKVFIHRGMDWLNKSNLKRESFNNGKGRVVGIHILEKVAEEVFARRNKRVTKMK